MSGFDIAADDSRKIPVTPFDTEVARCLLENLKQAKLVRGTPRIPTWAEAIRLLRTHDKVPPERIKAVLLWYVDHLGGERLPMAYSGDAFRRKFTMIEAAMAIAADRPPNPNEVRPEVAAQIKLMGLHWPPNTRADEAGPCLQKSVDAYKDFRTRLVAARATPPAGLTGFRKTCWPNLMEELLNRTRGAELEIAEAWLREVHTIAWRWEEWSGHLAKWAWRPTVRRWAKLAAGWVMEFCGHAFTWDEIIKELYADRTP